MMYHTNAQIVYNSTHERSSQPPSLVPILTFPSLAGAARSVTVGWDRRWTDQDILMVAEGKRKRARCDVIANLFPTDALTKMET